MSTLRPFGLIGTSIWQSEKFTSLNAMDSRLAYLWLHTSAKTCAGVLRIGPAHLLEEVDFVDSLDRASAIFTELVSADLISWARPYVVIQNYIRFNPVKTYRHAIGAFNEALAMPDSPAKVQLMNVLWRQAGAMSLAKWRNKAGDPHEVLFQISAYFEDNLTPLEPHQNPIENPSGRNRNETINEKGERTIGCAPEKPSNNSEMWDSQRKDARPTQATLNSVLGSLEPQ